MLSFHLPDGGRVEPVIGRLVLAGFAGRSAADVEAHIEEMARQGVKRPPFAPMLWPVAPRLITQGTEIAVYGPDTVAEVEYVLFAWRDRFYVTVGNDQCDIEVERELSSEKSKNLCSKVLAASAWPVDDVLDHWDDLELSLACNGTVMQQDRLAALIRPETLLAKLAALDGAEANGRMVFSGTIAAKGAYPPAPYRIDMRITDPVRGLEIRHGFTVTALAPLH
ncbi:MAG TPA: DUF2848 family protein [Nordella sp.]|nr:DUF2848 family protein [Nordella sp.]